MSAQAPDPPADPEDGAGVPEEWPTAVVPAALAGRRLDVAAAQLFPEHSRSRLQAWIEDGGLTVNGACAARARDAVAEGDVLELRAELPALDSPVEPQDLPLTVLHADASLAIVHKPAGLTVHPGAGQRDGTLQNALLFHYPQTAAVPRAGIVHRLDKDTSGLLVVALTPSAHTRLVAMLARREVRREYDALVTGDIVAGGSVAEPIGRHPRDRLKMAVVAGGRPAVSHYRVQERFKYHTHLRVRLETGRTHQIRVHLSHRRHPIVGDALYGGRIARGAGMSEALRSALLGFPRQALHARELELEHPHTGLSLKVVAEPPDDLLELLEVLRRETPMP